MNWLESLIYGFISGISEFLPISSQAHQTLMLRLFGLGNREPVRDLLVHMALLAGLIIGCWSTLLRLYREQKLMERSRRTRGRRPELRGIYDLRLVKTAALPMLAGMLLYVATGALENNLPLLAVLVLLNGLLLYLPDRVPQGNKDARSMSSLDAILISLSGLLSAFPGISRVGAAVTLASVRGADRRNSLSWALLLSIPACVLYLFFDVVGIINTAGIVMSWPLILQYFLSIVGALAGSYLGVLILRAVVSARTLSGFSFYSWGLSMLLFIIYLIA